MNIKSLYYFVEAAKDLNFTQTAKRLYISQQALSQHITKLEEQYGLSLFIRKPRLTLSYAGESLLPHAERLLREEQLVKHLFSDISKQEQGSLRIAVTIPRCRVFLPKVVHDFKQRYPNVHLDIITPSTTSALNMVVGGDCNIAIGLLRLHHPDLEMIELAQDPWYVLISDSLLREHYSDEEVSTILNSKTVTFPMVSKIPFIIGNSRSDPESSFKNQASNPDNNLNILFSSTSPQNFPEFAIQGYAAVIESHMSLSSFRDSLPDHVHVLTWGNPYPSSQMTMTMVSLAYNKNRYMPSHCEYFIKLITEYFEELKHETTTDIQLDNGLSEV